MKPTRVALLDGGSLAIDGYKVYWNRGPSGDIRFPVYSVLIDHEDGLFIYDTGFDLLHMQTFVSGDQPWQTPEQTLPAQLAKLGLKPTDVTHVLSSHLHIDHAGGHEFFPDALVYLHEAEYAQAQKPAAVRAHELLRPQLRPGAGGGPRRHGPGQRGRRRSRLRA